MKNRKFLKILIVLLAVVIAGVIFSCTYKKSGQSGEEVLADASEESVSSEETNETTETDETEEQICVYVCGCVMTPGVYFMDSGSRIFQAVELAGGFAEGADQDYLNLAAAAEDGQQIYIPSVTEVEEGQVPASAGCGTDSLTSDDGLVNINTATAEELATLPGIGDTKAAAIITYRENVGAFSDISDIMNVAGIKESSYEKIKDYIKV